MCRTAQRMLAGPWLLFALGWTAETAVDHHLRSLDGLPWTGGLPRTTWFGLHIAIATAAVALAAMCLRRFRWPVRLLLVVAQLAVGFPLYVFACLSYGIATGIDHF